MPASPSSLIASLSPAPAGLRGLRLPELTVGLPAALAAVPDPRARRGIRHRLAVVLIAAVCAVVAGHRSYTAIGEWVQDLPAATAILLGIDTERRPSEAMIRRLLQAVDPDLLAAAIGTWLATRIPEPASGSRRAIAVDGKTLRGSRTRHTSLLTCTDDLSAPAVPLSRNPDVTGLDPPTLRCCGGRHSQRRVRRT